MKNPAPEDIAGMKARGDDPLAIAGAEVRAARRCEAAKVCCLIEAAFSGVMLGHGVGLAEAQGLDEYADAATCAEARAGDEKDDWHRIPAGALNNCFTSLCFFDAEGMRFHLPAYLLADLRGEYRFGLAFNLTRLTEYNPGMFNLLDPEQRRVVRAYLQYIAGDPEYRFDRLHILRGLEEYWGEPE